MKPEKDSVPDENETESSRPKKQGCLAEVLGGCFLEAALWLSVWLSIPICFFLFDALNIKSTFAQVALFISPLVILAIVIAVRAKKDVR